MLPTLIYEPADSARASLADALGQLEPPGSQRLRVALSTGSVESMERAIDGENGITMAILGVRPEGLKACVALGERLMKKNPANYVLFCLHDILSMQELFGYFLRPAGILTLPLEARGVRAVLGRILKDFEDQTAGDAPDKFLMIEAGSTVYRLELGRIHYLEALDKLLTIHTDRQNITVRKSLSQLSQALDDRFVRCHRAYIVNRHIIERVDFSQMLLYLKNGEALPVSRSQRGVVRQALEAVEGAHDVG